MFIDHAKIVVKAGDGGDGCISFRREKYVPRGGPDGGDGGAGGDVILQVAPNLQTLLDFHYRHIFQAANGESGQGARKSGKNGASLVVMVPPGTIVKDAQASSVLTDLVHPGQEYIAARGGKGGLGNTHFATPTRQAPRLATDGGIGTERQLILELKLIADVGLVGFPNAGKSTLLARVSAARPKIADYPFTTLAPNLGLVQVGEYFKFVMADIPGLIEGAHLGKGLGHQFLNHILRTRMLVILIDSQSEDMAQDYQVLLAEMAQFSEKLLTKPRIVALTKIDLINSAPDPDRLRSKFDNLPLICISAVAGTGITELLQLIARQLTSQGNG
ncbi:GTPase ObgE [candidate division KSB1 bacterium]|nr:GTPase ObgE [candidate division KSB1 bacterium]